MSLISAIVLLVLVMDGLGDIPVFLSALRNVPQERWRPVILREMAFAAAILLAFLFLGPWILKAMQVSERSLTIGGGMVLFLIAVRMVFPRPGGPLGEGPEGEPFLVPLAIPYVAGPSAIATVMLIMSREPNRWLEWAIAVLVASSVTCVFLLLAPVFRRFLGDKGLSAVERLMGLVLVTIAVEMFLRGIREFVGSLTT